MARPSSADQCLHMPEDTLALPASRAGRTRSALVIDHGQIPLPSTKRLHFRTRQQATPPARKDTTASPRHDAGSSSERRPAHLQCTGSFASIHPGRPRPLRRPPAESGHEVKATAVPCRCPVPAATTAVHVSTTWRLGAQAAAGPRCRHPNCVLSQSSVRTLDPQTSISWCPGKSCSSNARFCIPFGTNWQAPRPGPAAPFSACPPPAPCARPRPRTAAYMVRPRPARSSGSPVLVVQRVRSSSPVVYAGSPCNCSTYVPARHQARRPAHRAASTSLKKSSSPLARRPAAR